MRNKKSITEWIDITDQDQLDFLNEKLPNWCSQIPGIHHLTGVFYSGDKYQRIFTILKYLEENNHKKTLRTVKQRWASKKSLIKANAKFIFHTIRISPEADSVLKKLCCNRDSTSIHETIESIILKQYQKNVDDIKEEKERKRKKKAEEAHNKMRRFKDSERTKRLSSNYISLIKHSALKSELADKEKALNIALLEIGYLKERVASKELSIDNQLSKISSFIGKLDSNEIISSTPQKPPVSSDIIDKPMTSPDTKNDLKSVLYKPK